MKYLFPFIFLMTFCASAWPQDTGTAENSLDQLPVVDRTVPECKTIASQFLLIWEVVTTRKTGKPKTLKNGSVPLVVKFIQDNYNDPYSVRYLEWTGPTALEYYDLSYWRVILKHRAQNTFGAYILLTSTFYIMNGEVYDDETMNVFKSLAATRAKEDAAKNKFYIALTVQNESIEDLAYRCQVDEQELYESSRFVAGTVFGTDEKTIKLPKGYVPIMLRIKGDFVIIVEAETDETIEAFSEKHSMQLSTALLLNDLTKDSVVRKGQKVKILIKN